MPNSDTSFDPDLDQSARLFSCLLGLERPIVAVSLAEFREQYENWPQPQLRRRLSFCLLVRLAATGRARKAAGAHFRCPGSAEVFGFRQPAEGMDRGKRLHGLGLYADREIAAGVGQTMARLEKPCYGVAVMPLQDCTSPPKSVLFLVTPYQAMRLVQGWSYHFGAAEQFTLTGNRGICSECVAKPLATGSLHLSPLCANTRYAANWRDSELGVGVPYTKLAPLLDGLLRTYGPTEPEKRKAEIRRRCRQAGLSDLLSEGSAYFTRK